MAKHNKLPFFGFVLIKYIFLIHHRVDVSSIDCKKGSSKDRVELLSNVNGFNRSPVNFIM